MFRCVSLSDQHSFHQNSAKRKWNFFFKVALLQNTFLRCLCDLKIKDTLVMHWKRRKECKDKINDWVILFSSVLLFKKSFRVLWNKNYISKSNPSHLDDVMINIMQCAQWGKIWNLRNLDPVLHCTMPANLFSESALFKTSFLKTLCCLHWKKNIVNVSVSRYKSSNI